MCLRERGAQPHPVLTAALEGTGGNRERLLKHNTLSAATCMLVHVIPVHFLLLSSYMLKLHPVRFALAR